MVVTTPSPTTASRTLRPSATTSGPIPSPPITASNGWVRGTVVDVGHRRIVTTPVRSRSGSQSRIRGCVSVTIMSHYPSGAGVRAAQESAPSSHHDERTAILDNPGFGTNFTDHMAVATWTAGRRLARLGGRAVRAVRARPGDGRAALRAGDLRGTQGLPARRTAASGCSGPTRTRTGSPGRRAGWRCRCSSRDDFLGSIEALVAADVELGAVGWGEEPLPAAVHVRVRGVPRRPRGAPGDLLLHRQPGRVLLRLRGEAGQDLDLHRPTPGRPPAGPGRPSAAATTPPA